MNPNYLIVLHDSIGNLPFIIMTLGMSLLLCKWLIPQATNLMTDSASALTSKYLGETWKTVVINCTTNIPELFLMLISLLGFQRLGGIDTPLGSNFTNIYLMFLFAPLILLIKWFAHHQFFNVQRLLHLFAQEKSLIIWHFLLSLLMLGFAILSSWLIIGNYPLANLLKKSSISSQQGLLIGGALCLLGVYLFFVYFRKLKQKRPHLFQTSEEDNASASWLSFAIGSSQVILYCSFLNLLFLAWSQLYSSILSQIFGSLIFASLHFFIGSLISSIPEIVVALENYEKIESYGLNTALSSASVSNMSNLAIASIGSVLGCLLPISSV